MERFGVRPYLKLLSTAGLLALASCTNASPEIDLKTGDKITNSAPVISASCSASATQDVSYGCTPSYSDADGDSMLWSMAATNTCTWLTINAATGVVSGSANDDEVGTCKLAIVAGDGMDSSNIVSVDVTVANVYPLLSIADATVNEDAGSTVVRNDAAVTANEEGFGTYSLNDAAATSPKCSNYSSISIDSSTGAVTLTPSANYNGACNVSVHFDDGNGGSVDDEFSVTVSPVNDAPSAPDLSNCSTAGTVYVDYGCTVSSSDIDAGDTQTWSMDSTNTCSWASIGSSSGVISGQPQDPGACLLAVKVTDSGGASATNFITVTSTLPFFDPANGGGTGFDVPPNMVLTMASIPNSQKIYVGGTFTQYNGAPAYRLARLNPDGTIDSSFVPASIDATVWDIAVDPSGKLYVAGAFSGPYSNLMRLNSNGTIDTGFNPPAPSGIVKKILLSGSTLYLAGSFTSLGGSGPSYLASLNASDGSLLPWNPGANSTVNTMVLSGTRLLVGGAFTNIGGQIRKGLADTSIIDGSVSSWNPSTTTTNIKALAINGAHLIVGGAFTAIGGQIRTNLAAIDLSTGLATSWDPAPNSVAISAIAVTGTRILVGGGFTNISITPRTGFAQYDKSSYSLISSSFPTFDLDVLAILEQPTRIYLGGNFSTANSTSRNGIAAIDPATGVNN